MVPMSLSVWTQRYGRAGRAGQDAEAILLVEPYVYQLKKKKAPEANKENDVEGEQEEEEEDDDDDDGLDQMPASHADPKYKKRVEWGLRNWIEGTDCRNAVSNKYYANPHQGGRDQGAYVLSISTILLTH
jgi:superfamily II DNA helicase RecQ